MAGALRLKQLYLCLVCMVYEAWTSSSSCSFARLANNSAPNAGRVEVYYNNYWRSICDSNWDLKNAHVICRMLGYNQGAIAAIRGIQGLDDFWLSDVSCTGNETTIESCRNLKWGERSCVTNSRAGVVCKSDDRPDVAVRLVNGNSSNEGRVEVRYYGVWGTVCHDTWDSRDAHVVCRMLNYSKATWVGTAKVIGRGPILLDDIKCLGNEKSLEDCRVVQWGKHDCAHHEDAAVTCENSTKVSVRLVGNKTNHFGSVEVNYHGTWRPVCDDTWDISDARVVCRMLGYQGDLLGMKRFRVIRNNSLWMGNIECTGEEQSISECYHRGWSNTYCPESLTGAAFCKVSEDQISDVAVRLVNGSTPNQGRVEVRYYGMWGTVCDDRWGLADAHVVCRMLKYSKASWAGKAKVSGSGYILLDEVKCLGNEKSLEQCRHQGWGQHNCDHSEDAAVTCAKLTQEESSVAVRIVGGEHLGSVEVQYNGTWRPVCDDTWDISDAHVVCRMLGYKVALQAIKRFSVGKAGYWMGGVECSGQESLISECYHRGWANTICHGDQVAGVLCQPKENSLELRLEDGRSPNSGRVGVRYGNVWGTICNRGLDINDAKVICRMLGYPGARMLYPKSTFRPGNGTIWLSDLECNGTENSIADCRHPGWGQATCNHEDDVAVECKLADAPQFHLDGLQLAESTAVLMIKASTPIKAVFESAHQIICEKIKNKNIFSSMDQTKIRLPSDDQDVTMATRKGSSVYITAEVPYSNGSVNFTVGDGRSYNGYYNTPLEPGSAYKVHIRIVTKDLNGRKVYGHSAFVSFTAKPGERESKFFEAHGGVVIALSAANVFLLVIFGYFVRRRRQEKRERQEKAKETRDDQAEEVEMTDQPHRDTTRHYQSLHREEPHEQHDEDNVYYVNVGVGRTPFQTPSTVVSPNVYPSSHPLYKNVQH